MDLFIFYLSCIAISSERIRVVGDSKVTIQKIKTLMKFITFYDNSLEQIVRIAPQL